jgi:hypothetical protein
MTSFGPLSENWVKYILLSFKKKEYGKNKKYPRVYANLGIHSSLRGFRLMDYLKIAMSRRPYRYKGGRMEFIKSPARHRLREVFRNLINPTGKYYASVFSDDSCLAIRCGNEVKMYNMDISSCDASHYEQVFQDFIEIFPPILRDEITQLVAQCESTCKIFSQDGVHYVKLKPNGPFLPSGSVLTTAFNTFAVYRIIRSIIDEEATTAEEIKAAASKVGYILTVEHCETYHKLQFLKHSPARDVHGHLQPVLNLGVILRLSGTCVGDLPGRGPLQPRAAAFQKALLRGAVPYMSYDMIDIMKAQVATSDELELTKRELNLQYKVDFANEGDQILIPMDSYDIYRRYDLTQGDIMALHAFAASGFEEFSSLEAHTKILALDYDITAADLVAVEDDTVRY